MGEMAREMEVAGWYAPGINMHRYPFGGRNYEYYSEDAVLTGLMSGNAVAGAEQILAREVDKTVHAKLLEQLKAKL